MVDYSKCKNIGNSDDDDDFDPSTSTGAPSLFKWRQKLRSTQTDELARKFDVIKRMKQENAVQQGELRADLIGGGLGVGAVASNGHEAELKEQLEFLEHEYYLLENAENDLKKNENLLVMRDDVASTPANVLATINRGVASQRANELLSVERQQELWLFVEKHEQLCRQYGMLRRYDDSMRFLQENPVIICDLTSNYMLLWAIILETEKQHELVIYVAHQSICLQYILEMSRKLNLDLRGCVTTFYMEIQCCMPEYRERFNYEIETFNESIKQRAQRRIEETQAYTIEMERKARLGPGGLDLFEVFDSLPYELKVCFEKQDVDKLQKTILTMPTDVGLNYIKRCVDAGIWVPSDDNIRQQAAYVNLGAQEARRVASFVAEVMEASEQKKASKVSAVETILSKVANIFSAMWKKLIITTGTSEEASGGILEADEQSSVATSTDLEGNKHSSADRVKLVSCLKVSYSQSESDIDRLRDLAEFSIEQLNAVSDDDEESEECKSRSETKEMCSTHSESNSSMDKINEQQLANADFEQYSQETEPSSPVSESIEENSETQIEVIEELDEISTSIGSEGTTQIGLTIEEQYMSLANEIVEEENANEMASIIVASFAEQCDETSLSKAEAIDAKASTIKENNAFDDLQQELTDEETQLRQILEVIDQLDESSCSATNFASQLTSVATTQQENEEINLLMRTADQKNAESSKDHKSTTEVPTMSSMAVLYRNVTTNDLV